MQLQYLNGSRELVHSVPGGRRLRVLLGKQARHYFDRRQGVLEQERIQLFLRGLQSPLERLSRRLTLEGVVEEEGRWDVILILL